MDENDEREESDDLILELLIDRAAKYGGNVECEYYLYCYEENDIVLVWAILTYAN